MTKAEAIKRFQRLKKILSIPNSDAAITIEALDMAIDALQQQTKWIPCAERLPNKTIHCLVTTGTLNFVQIAVYSALLGTIDHKIFWQGEYGRDSFRDITQWVTAWMPLPEPYKESEEE